MGSNTQVVKNKRIDVRSDFDGFAGAAGAMTGIGFDADEHRILVTGEGLQGGRVFERVSGNDAIVVVGSGDEGGRVDRTGLDVVQG